MTLRTKTFISIASILVIMTLIICASTRLIILSGFANLEKNSILRSADQAVKTLTNEQTLISNIARDWATWNDTYEFVQNGNQDYIDEHLVDAAMLKLPIDFMIFLNKKQQTIHCTYIDPDTDRGTSCPNTLLQYVSTDSFKQHILSNRENTITGFDLLPEYPFTIAFSPILTSNLEGPSTGTLIVGRLLTDLEIKRLGQAVDLSINIQRYNPEQQLPKHILTTKELLSPEKDIKLYEKDENTLGAYIVLNNISDKPILVLNIDEERLVLAQGKKSARYFLIAITLTAILFIFVTLLFLETKILSKISSLNRQIKFIGTTGDLSQKTTLDGHDELAILSTEINQMLESVRASTERDRAILESIENGYFELDLNGNITLYNRSFVRLFRPSAHDISGINYRQLIDRRSAVKTIKAFKQLYESQAPIKDFETGLILESGEQRYFESTLSVITNDSEQVIGFRGIARDITEKKKAAEKLIYMVYHDSLTDLLNRKALYDNLVQELSYAARYNQERSLLFIDLDGFKTVNDTYGHNVGDSFLVRFSKRLQETLRETDLIYRLGGDEFAVISSNPNGQNPEMIAQRICDMMQKPFLINGITIDFVTTSIGVSVFPLNGKDPDILLQLADSKMYEAKKAKNSFSVASE